MVSVEDDIRYDKVRHGTVCEERMWLRETCRLLMKVFEVKGSLKQDRPGFKLPPCVQVLTLQIFWSGNHHTLKG